MSSARVICPHCQAKLRLSTSGGPPDRAKCHKCGRTFAPKFDVEIKSGATYLDASVNSTSIMGQGTMLTPPPAAPAPVAPKAVILPSPPPVAEIAAPPPVGWSAVSQPAVAVMTPPPEPTLAAPPEPRELSSPALPAVARKRGDSRRQAKLDEEWVGRRRLKPYELVLALTIVLGAAAGGGLLWYQNSGPTRSSAAEAPAEDGPPLDPAAQAPKGDVVENDTLARPAELIGNWELRADDGRGGVIRLDPDGKLLATSVSWSNPVPDYLGQWFVLDHDGDRYLLEFGSVHRGPDSYRVRIQLTGPDAFTLMETVKGGTPIRDNHRFVRMTEPDE
jgi:hypothetical protein